MNLNRIYSILLLLLITSLASAANDEAGLWLDRLDKSLANKDKYENIKKEHINSLRNLLSQSTSNETKFETCRQLFEEYKVYRYDSALAYANHGLSLAQKMKDENHIAQARCDVAFCQISAGIMFEAHRQLASIRPAQLTQPVRRYYYSVWAKFWRENADFARDEPYYSQYIKISNTYMDSLLQTTKRHSSQWWSYLGSSQMRQKRYGEAIRSFSHSLEDPKMDAHERAMQYAELGWAYRHMGDEGKAVIQFIRSAIYDNETATREITALYLVAQQIYKDGSYDRANHYVRLALDEITFYNTRQRKIEIGEIIPIIEQDRYNALQSQRNWLIAAVTLAVILALVTLFGFLYIRKQNRNLLEAKKTIEGHAGKLSKANEQLREANKIKTEYIGRSFYANAEFMAKLEQIFRRIDRRIATRQYDAVRQVVNQEALEAERNNMYAAFDEAFLRLYPDYVEKYNNLFDEKDRKMPDKEHALTSEMRIFALIRLGVSDSERIAKFLDYSVHTVNTYKTRIKNRSRIDNDQFEKRIMEI
ncbi:MAG: DUF6377 domain-containing protein [Prevotella sp.]|nr:DUF6377 domain-containing protein [Prevotella sp.]